MDTTTPTHPRFEANQVLTNQHLNQLFAYLDEQERLTRANLIGIGIACGLEVSRPEPSRIHLTKGCGITSEGYLIVEAEDLDLIAVRPYVLPAEPTYPPFTDPTTTPSVPFDLWELLSSDDDPGAQLLASSGLVLEDKAVLLFLELRQDALRTCGPNDCDDRGAEVTATARPLLIDITDLDVMRARVGSLGTTLPSDRIALPDLRMPRFDVPNTTPVTTADVLRGFGEAFRREQLATRAGTALRALYQCFRPVVDVDHPIDPFAGFENRFGFLDRGPGTGEQALALPTYWDFFDDLLRAYDEARWSAGELICSCCPPADLFPRHLVAGVLDPTAAGPERRQQFIASPAVDRCEPEAARVRALFDRLVAMVRSFTARPDVDQVKLTPSRVGDAALGERAIPHYYDLDPASPINERWDPVKTARGRANQNLGYRSPSYVPPAPSFVTDPLRYDLDPNDFLRIEGHLGRPVSTVLGSVLTARSRHRLPFEVVALRTGAFDESVELDVGADRCRFQDLDALYEVLRAELTCHLVKQTKFWYALPDPAAPVFELRRTRLPLLTIHDPDWKVPEGTIGRRLEGILDPTISIEADPIISAPGVANLPAETLQLVTAMSDLADGVPESLDEIDIGTVSERYRRLVGIAERMKGFDLDGAYDAPGLIDQLNDVVLKCRLDPFEALAAERARRIREAKEELFLATFLARNPGISHRSGVPLGGTLVLVCHAGSTAGAGTRPGPADVVRPPWSERIMGTGENLPSGISDALSGVMADVVFPVAAEATPIRGELSGIMADAGTPIRTYGASIRERVLEHLFPRFHPGFARPEVYDRLAEELADGTVIADFYLPGSCRSDCQPIQFTLPTAPLRVVPRRSCTDGDGIASVALDVTGATGALSVQIDGAPFAPVEGPLRLEVGDHEVVVRDALGHETAPVAVVVPPALTIAGSENQIDDASGTYVVNFTMRGGTPPYHAEGGTVIVGSAGTTEPAPLTEARPVVIIDDAGCRIEASFGPVQSPCDLPCDGASERTAHLFWMPEPVKGTPFKRLVAQVGSFLVTDPDGNQTDLASEAEQILREISSVSAAEFASRVRTWLRKINALIEQALGANHLELSYVEAAEGVTTGRLIIDRLVCVHLAAEIGIDYLEGDARHSTMRGYEDQGTLLRDKGIEGELAIPALDVETWNRCHPDEPPQHRCERFGLPTEIGVEPLGDRRVLLFAAPPGDELGLTYLWEIEGGTPPFAVGDGVEVTFDETAPQEPRITITGYTPDGCSASAHRQIRLEGL